MRRELPEFERVVSTATDRRQNIRLKTPRRLRVSIGAIAGPIAIKDISIRGICVLADSPLALRSVHQVTLTFGSRTFTQYATTIHCHQHLAGGWWMGMEFVGEAPQSYTIDELVDDLIAEDRAF